MQMSFRDFGSPHGAQPMAPKRHGYKITDLFQNLIA
jgi:hypothetical protein